MHEFLLHLQACRAPKTVRFYRIQMRQFLRWADANAIPFIGFGKRHLNRYLAERSQTVCRATMRHDAICLKSLFKWCAKNDLIARSPLAEYEIHNAPRPAKYMPSEEVDCIPLTRQSFRQVIAYAIGDHSEATCRFLWSRMPDSYRKLRAYSDFYQVYLNVLPEELHEAVSKRSGQTNHICHSRCDIERFNNTLMQRLACLVRDTLSFSKDLANERKAVGEKWE